MRKDREVINPGLYVFLLTEKKEDKDSSHKLAPLAEGPYLVKEVDVDSKTVVTNMETTRSNEYRAAAWYSHRNGQHRPNSRTSSDHP